MKAGNEMVAPPAGRTTRRRWFTAIHALALMLASVALPAFSGSWPLKRVYTEWAIWLVVLEVLGLPWFFFCGGLSATPREKLATGAAHILLFSIAGLYFMGVFEYAFIRFLELALRLGIGGLWLFALAGFPYVAIWLWRWTRGRRREFRLAKWWLSAVVALVTAEPLAGIVQRRAVALSTSEAVALPARLADPEPGELRVLAVGESTMLGYPYELKFGIAQVIGWRLGQIHPARRVVVENLAHPGANLRQAVRRLSELRVRPQLMLLYGGHNEFYHELDEAGLWSESPFNYFDRPLSWSPTFRMFNEYLSQKRFVRSMRIDARRLVDEAIDRPEANSRRLARFRRHLEQLAEYCERQQIPALWFVPAASEADFEPNRSFATGTSNADREEIEQLYASARHVEGLSDWRRAAELYRRGLDLSPGFAEFHFRLAECLVQAGRFDEAQQHFLDAMDHDGQPIRANRAFRRQVAEVAREHSIMLIDAADVLRPHTPFGVLDRSVFHDEVHPKPPAVFHLALAAVERIEEAALFGSPEINPSDAPVPNLPDAVRDLGLEAKDLATAYVRLGNHYKWLGRMRFDSTRREREAAQCFNWAERLESGEIQPGDDGTESLR